MRHSHTTWGLSLNEQSKLPLTAHSFIGPSGALSQITIKLLSTAHTLTYAQREALLISHSCSLSFIHSLYKSSVKV